MPPAWTEADVAAIVRALSRREDPHKARHFALMALRNVDLVLALPWLDREPGAIEAVRAGDRAGVEAVADAAHRLRVALERLELRHREAWQTLQGAWSGDVPQLGSALPIATELEEVARALVGRDGRPEGRPKTAGAAALVVQGIAFAWIVAFDVAPPCNGPTTRFLKVCDVVLDRARRAAPELMGALGLPHHSTFPRLVAAAVAADRDGASFGPAIFLIE